MNCRLLAIETFSIFMSNSEYTPRASENKYGNYITDCWTQDQICKCSGNNVDVVIDKEFIWARCFSFENSNSQDEGVRFPFSLRTPVNNNRMMIDTQHLRATLQLGKSTSLP